jgi:hypothetical protein
MRGKDQECPVRLMGSDRKYSIELWFLRIGIKSDKKGV